MALPVLVLTGALGAGKTTLLNAALKSGVLSNAAVVVNEFGAVGIDHALIESSSEDVVLLPGGCVCCQVRADLAEALLRLERSAARGEIPPYERIVVETSGLAEPGPILQLFIESPMLMGRYRLEGILTVVDGLLGESALGEEGTAFRQALLADRLVVSKTESVSLASLETLNARLSAINPHADLVVGRKGVVEAAWFAPATLDAERMVPVESRVAVHDDSIESFVLQWQEAQPLAEMGSWLQGLSDNYGARLLRVKGIVAVEEDPRAVAVHVVQHLVSPPDFLERPAAVSRVVFITRGLEPGDVRPSWPTSALASPAPRRPQAASTPTLQRATAFSSAGAVRP